MILSLGKIGENIACEYLKYNSYSILERNFRSRYGEIDIICKRGDQIIFVEVKTRSNTRSGYPYEAANQPKQARILKCGYFYLQTRRQTQVSVRIDVISIVIHNESCYKYSLSHYENILSIDN